MSYETSSSIEEKYYKLKKYREFLKSVGRNNRWRAHSRVKYMDKRELVKEVITYIYGSHNN